MLTLLACWVDLFLSGGTWNWTFASIIYCCLFRSMGFSVRGWGWELLTSRCMSLTATLAGVPLETVVISISMLLALMRVLPARCLFSLLPPRQTLPYSRLHQPSPFCSPSCLAGGLGGRPASRGPVEAACKGMAALRKSPKHPPVRSLHSGSLQRPMSIESQG